MFLEYDWGTPAYAASIILRQDILRLPLGMKFSINELAEEYKYRHFAIFDECMNIKACLYIKNLGDNKYQLKQMAVQRRLQGKGYGSKLIKNVERCLRNADEDVKLILHARETAVGFYKHLDYEIVSKKFIEIGLTHYKMEKILQKLKKTY